MRYRFIHDILKDNAGQFSIRALCTQMEVSPSGYYAWRDRKPSQRTQENTRLLLQIRVAYRQSRERYGSPRIYHELRVAGHSCGRHRVARLMKKDGLAAKRKKRFRVTTKTRSGMAWFQDILERDFSPAQKNLQWAADMTYLWTPEGWMYLAVVMDLFSRRIVGWSAEPYLTDTLPMKAMQAALMTRRPGCGLVHHSDRGSQYGSKNYLKLLSEHGIISSMSEKGDCWDNAPMVIPAGAWG